MDMLFVWLGSNIAVHPKHSIKHNNMRSCPTKMEVDNGSLKDDLQYIFCKQKLVRFSDC